MQPVRPPDTEWGVWRSADGLIWWEAALDSARVIVTTRMGGVSHVPFDTLNLGLHVGDAPDAVMENRRALGSMAVPAPCAPVLAEQVHGAAAVVVEAADAGRGWRERETAVPATDALVTREADLPIAILVADCAPVALVGGGVLGVAHAGWRGLAGGVLEATLQRMAELSNAPAGECRAIVGPCIRGCCYEVGEEVWRRFPAGCLAPSEKPHTRRLDLMAAVVHRLRAAGLLPEQIHATSLCTACHPELFFSHRRATKQGLPTTGRMLMAGWLPERGG